MKVYTAGEDADKVQRVVLWWRTVTHLATKVVIWPGPAGWGVGYVVLLRSEGGFVVDLFKRHSGIIKVELRKEEQK